MRELLTILILLTYNLTSFSQHNFGVKINGGISKISNDFTIANIDIAIKFAPSGHAGLFYTYQVSEKSLLGTELLFLQIEGKEVWAWDSMDDKGNIIGHTDNEEWIHFSYISLPIYYGLRLNKLTIIAGWQTSLLLYQNIRYHREWTYYSKAYHDDNNTGKFTNLNSYDYGIRIGVLYRLTDKFSIDWNYYQGLNNIMNPKKYEWMPSVNLKNQQMTIGIRYAFWTSKTKNDIETE